MKHNLNLQLVLIALFCSCCHIIQGQNMTVKSVIIQPNDQTAIQHPCLDNNGDTCALLKIKTDHLEGIEFSNPNQYVKVDYSDGLYSVYVPTITRKLDFLHKDFIPVQIDLADYGYRKLRKGKTYLITLEAHRISELKSSIIIKVVPTNSKIILDDQQYEPNTSGTFELPVASGKHQYTIAAENHESQNGVFLIVSYYADTSTIERRNRRNRTTLHRNCNIVEIIVTPSRLHHKLSNRRNHRIIQADLHRRDAPTKVIKNDMVLIHCLHTERRLDLIIHSKKVHLNRRLFIKVFVPFRNLSTIRIGNIQVQ